MATIVNTPSSAPVERDNGMGFFLGMLVLLAMAVLFFMYALPVLTNTFNRPQVNVPGQIDVNVNTPNTGTGK